MTQNRLGLATAVLLVLVGLVVWRISARKSEDQPAPSKAEVKLPKLDTKTIDELELTTPDDGKVALKKQGEQWRVAEPLDAKADQDAVQTALTKLGELEVTGTASTKSKNHERLEVDPKKGTRVVAKSGGKPLLDGYVGVYQSGNTMFRLHGQEPVVMVKGSIRYAFGKALREWRDREITKVETNAVQEVVFENKNGSYRFVRAGEEWKQVPAKGKKPIAPLDMPKVKGLVGTAASLNAVDFAEPGVTPEQAGLGAGAATVHVKTGGTDAGAAQEILYRVGAEKDKNFYLMREGDPTIYLVSAWVGGRLVPNDDTFVKKEPQQVNTVVDPTARPGSAQNPIKVEPIKSEVVQKPAGTPPPKAPAPKAPAPKAPAAKPASPH
jgi:hypothetical protein